MSERKFDPITGQPITDNTPTSAPNPQQPVGQNNMNQQPAGNTFSQPVPPANKQPGQPFGQPTGNQPGQPFGQPAGNQPGQPFGKPAGNQPGQPFGKPAGNQPGQAPFGQPAGNQPGQPFGQPMGNQPGQPFGQPMGNQPGQPPFGQPAGNQFGTFPGQAPKKGLSTTQIIIIVVAAVALIAIVAVLFGMGSKSSKDDYVPDKEIVEDVEPEEEPEEEPEKEPEEDDDKTSKAAPVSGETNISNFSVDGKQYTLPVDINEFLDNGWKYRDPEDADVKINKDQTEIISMTYSGKGDSTVSMFVINHSIDARPVSECMIADVSISDSFVKRTGAEVKFCNDQFTLQKTTPDEVKDVLGEPNSTSTRDNTITYTYRGSDDDEFNLSTVYSFENEILTSVTMRNKKAPEDFEQPEVSTETPEYLSLYQAPTKLGDDILSGNVSINGVVYNVPVPYSELAKNGWKNRDRIDAIPSKHSALVTLENGNYRIFVEALNPLDSAVTLENSIVVSISASGFSDDFDFTLPGGIKRGMSKDELDKTLKDKKITDYKYEEKYNNYEIFLNGTDEDDYTNRQSIRIDIADSKNTVFDIDIERYDWLLKK